MEKILVNLLGPSNQGRMFYRSDPQVQPFGLYIESNSKLAKRAFSININGAIIIDLNKDYVIQFVDFIIHEKVWQTVSSLIIPETYISADVQISNMVEKDALIEIPVISETNENRNLVMFRWADHVSDKNWFALSEQCFANVVNSQLFGFLIRREENR